MNIKDVLAHIKSELEQGNIELCDPHPRTQEYCKRAIRKMNEKLFP